MRKHFGIVKDAPGIQCWTIQLEEIAKAFMEPPANDLLWNIMPTHLDSIRNSLKSKLYLGNPKEIQLNPITSGLQFSQQRNVRHTGESCFKTKICFLLRKYSNLFKEKPPCMQSSSFR